MISENELRIGNWVESYVCFYSGDVYDKNMKLLSTGSYSWPPIRQFQVTIEDIAFIAEQNKSIPAMYRPITITKEILLRCGFENLMDDEQPEYYFNGYTYYTDSLMFKTSSIEIKSLHHLQNLYFALEGTELIYKP